MALMKFKFESSTWLQYYKVDGEVIILTIIKMRVIID